MDDQLYCIELGCRSRGDHDVLHLGVSAKDGRSFTLYDGPAEMSEVRAWVKGLIFHQEDEFPFSLCGDESLSSAVQRMYDALDADSDGKCFDTLYNYRLIHDLSLNNRGVKTPIIIVGRRSGRMTISTGTKSFEVKDLTELGLSA
jgi:hypothetical protein